MRTKLAALSGIAALAATTGVLLAATSSTSAIKCPPPTHQGQIYGFTACTIGPVPPGCDPGPCDPTAKAPGE